MCEQSELHEEPDIVLEACQLSRTFTEANGQQVKANQQISFQLRRAHTLGIVGESGSGKSTLARILVRLDEPDSGDILLNYQNITHLKGEAKRLARRNIQMVFQNPAASLNPRMKIKELICEPLLNYRLISRREMTSCAARLLAMVELPAELGDRYPHTLSGGQNQRVSIARALALSPEVLICDEATSALDVSVQQSIVKLLLRLQQQSGIAMIFICHDLALARAISHDLIIMKNGKVVEEIPGALFEEGERHPYTKELMKAVYSVHGDTRTPPAHPHKKGA